LVTNTLWQPTLYYDFIKDYSEHSTIPQNT